MADFFYRQSNVVLPSGGRIRNNAYVTITGKEFSLPVATSGMTSTYDPNGTGRPAPALKSVKIQLKGEAGSLRSAEVSFTCFDVTSFNNLEKDLMLPGSEVTIEYGYTGPETPSEPGSHKFRVFDYSFKITKENYFDCTFKAVGKGGTFEQLEINRMGKFPADKFVTNYRYTNDQFKVANLFDHLQHLTQLKAMGTANSSGFNPPHGKSGILNSYDGDTGYYGVLKAPDEYNPPNKVPGGVGTDDRIQYVSLQAVVNAVNKYLIGPDLKIVFKKHISDIQTKYPSGNVWSPDPVSMLFPYAKGNHFNAYHETKTGKSEEFIAIDSFNSLAAMRLSTPVGSPADILLGRDLLVAIKQSFSDEALLIKNKSEASDAPTGGMPLNKFFKKIFATILENTGGAWDLYLDQDEEDTENGIITVVNRKCPGSDVEPTPVMLDPVSGTNGIRELSLSAKVPKDVQAKFFGGAPEVAAPVKVITEEQEEVDEPEPKLSIKDQQFNAMGDLTSNGYVADTVTKAKAAVKALVNEQTEKPATKTSDGSSAEQQPFPLEFAVTLDGIEGFQFGDTISSTYLPARYRKKDGSGKIVFTVTEYSHTIEGADWKTTVKAYGRLR